MDEYYTVVYLEDGKLREESFYPEHREEAITLAKEKRGYMFLTTRSFDFTEWKEN